MGASTHSPYGGAGRATCCIKRRVAAAKISPRVFTSESVPIWALKVVRCGLIFVLFQINDWVQGVWVRFLLIVKWEVETFVNDKRTS